VEIYPLPNKEARTVAKAMFEGFVCRFGVPRAVVADNDLSFGGTMKELSQMCGFKQSFIATYHPQANG